MKGNNVKKMVTAAMFAAMTCVATMIIHIPLPGGGYAHLGDCFVIWSGCLLGPPWGVAAAAIGSALSDGVLGYGIYAPATFFIKGIMALLAYGAYTAVGRNGKGSPIAGAMAASVLAAIVMVAGYFAYEWAVYDAAVAMVNVPGNVVQGAVGVAISSALPTVATVMRRQERGGNGGGDERDKNKPH